LDVIQRAELYVESDKEMVQAHGIVREPAPEPGEGRMVGRRLIKGKTKKLIGGDPVVDLDSNTGSESMWNHCWRRKYLRRINGG